jgi:hypothetical protein
VRRRTRKVDQFLGLEQAHAVSLRYAARFAAALAALLAGLICTSSRVRPPLQRVLYSHSTSEQRRVRRFKDSSATGTTQHSRSLRTARTPSLSLCRGVALSVVP